MSYSVAKHYKMLLANENQPRRSLSDIKKTALEELRLLGLTKKIDVKVTKTISEPDARAEYIRNGNIMKLHPINRFATMNDLRDTVRHEISRYRDETRPDRTKGY